MNRFPFVEALALWHEYVEDTDFRTIESRDTIVTPSFRNFILWLKEIKYI